jgi:catechol 2,3-dioxygenase-like lactoylglutathione lyase family enzyme
MYAMKARITVLTLGVDDLDRAVTLYRDGLGFATEGIVGTEFDYGAVAFFDLQEGLWLALWPRASLAHAAGLDVASPSATDFSIGHNVRTEAEVDAVMDRARRAGGAVVKAAERTFWGGYAGYFSDPDGHLWKVVFNPSQLPED